MGQCQHGSHSYLIIFNSNLHPRKRRASEWCQRGEKWESKLSLHFFFHVLSCLLCWTGKYHKRNVKHNLFSLLKGLPGRCKSKELHFLQLNNDRAKLSLSLSHSLCAAFLFKTSNFFLNEYPRKFPCSKKNKIKASARRRRTTTTETI